MGCGGSKGSAGVVSSAIGADTLNHSPRFNSHAAASSPFNESLHVIMDDGTDYDSGSYARNSRQNGAALTAGQRESMRTVESFVQSHLLANEPPTETRLSWEVDASSAHAIRELITNGAHSTLVSGESRSSDAESVTIERGSSELVLHVNLPSAENSATQAASSTNDGTLNLIMCI